VINELARRLDIPASQAADVIPFPGRT